MPELNIRPLEERDVATVVQWARGEILPRDTVISRSTDTPTDRAFGLVGIKGHPLEASLRCDTTMPTVSLVSISFKATAGAGIRSSALADGLEASRWRELHRAGLPQTSSSTTRSGASEASRGPFVGNGSTDGQRHACRPFMDGPVAHTMSGAEIPLAAINDYDANVKPHRDHISSTNGCPIQPETCLP